MLSSLGLLLVAVAIEVAGTSILPRTNGFREPVWTVLAIGAYAASLALLAVVVRELPISVAYAIWAGLGTAAVATIGVLFLGEPLDALRAVAIAMIVAGVIMLNLNGLTH